jgi:myosin-1
VLIHLLDVKVASRLLRCDMKFLEVCLTARTVTAGGRKSSYLTPLTLEQAISAKNALAKHLYDRLFGWLIATINKSILPKDRKNLTRIGILDIYGFEVFEKNSFEQLCINYVNERLQHLFVHHTLKSEQELYTSEGLSWKPVEYTDNKDCVSLIDSKLGVFDLLDDICTLNGTDDAFLDKLLKTQKLNKYLGQKQVKTPEFIIKHYAGDVTYHVKSFVKKNSDHLYNDLIELMQTSQCKLIREFFPEVPSEDKSKRPITCSQQFIKDVNQMMSRLFSAKPHYVRCIKPNSDKLANTFNIGEVKNQVKYLGLVETVKLYQSGYIANIPFDKFLARYKMLTRHTLLGKYTGEGGCYRIMRKLVGDNSGTFVCGRTRVFIKKPELLTMLEELRERTIPSLVSRIQRRWRCRMLKRTLKPLKDTYEKVFMTTKKRRRASIKRVYCGDYLEMSFSSVVQNIMKKYGDEKIYFSQYVNKVNNKGKIQKRVFVITDSAIYNFGSDANRPKFKKRMPINEIDWVAMRYFNELLNNTILVRIQMDFL